MGSVALTNAIVFNRQLTLADLELKICLCGERSTTDFIYILFICSFISYLTANPERFHQNSQSANVAACTPKDNTKHREWIYCSERVHSFWTCHYVLLPLYNTNQRNTQFSKLALILISLVSYMFQTSWGHPQEDTYIYMKYLMCG